MKKRFIVFAMMLVLILSGCGRTLIRERTGKQLAEVTERRYVPPNDYFIPMLIGETMIMTPMSDPEEWNVKLEYEGTYRIINNKKFYDAVDLGQKIEVYIDKYYTEDGEFVDQKIVLLDENEE